MRHSVNEARNSWTLLDTTTRAGQMGTSGSRPQRFKNGRKANKDNPISHCRPKLPGAQSWAGKIGFLFHGSRGKRGAGEPAVGLSFSCLWCWALGPWGAISKESWGLVAWESVGAFSHLQFMGTVMAMRFLNPSHEGYLHDLKGLLARDGLGTGKDLCVTVGACVKEVLSPYLRLHNGSTKSIVCMS